MAALAMFLVACGDDDEEPATADTAAQQSEETSADQPDGDLPDLSGVTISYLGFGGTLDEAFEKAWFEPFSEATGAEIILDSPTDYAKIETQVKSGNVQYDIVDIEPPFVDPRCGEMWERLEGVDLSGVLDPFQPGTPCGVPEVVFSTQIVYSNEAFPDGGPTTCEEFFDTEKYPGKRALFGYTQPGVLECAAIAAGADPADPYPIDFEKAFEVLNGAQDDIVIYDGVAESQDMLENNDVELCLCLARAIPPAIANGADITVGFDQVFRQFGYFAVPKGAPNKEAAEALLNYLIQPDVNERAQQYLIYGLPTGADHTLAAEDVQDFVSTGPKADAGAIDVDLQWWNENVDEAFERWGEFTAGG